MKFYQISFGTGDPRTYTGLSPTMLYFVNMTSGATVTPPSIAEVITGSGLYQFQYGTTQPISFIADGATTSVASARYVRGLIDPADRADEYGTTLVAIGTSHIAQGNTMIAIGTSHIAQGNTLFSLGTTAVALGITNVAIGTTLTGMGQTITVNVTGVGTAGSTFGGISTDPIDMFGYMKRMQEFLEGNAAFDKSSGSWSLYSRGSSTLLRTKTLANATTGITKS